MSDRNRTPGSFLARCLAGVRWYRGTSGVLLFALLAARMASSQTWSGGGSDANWSTAANWVGSSAPVSANTSDLTFDGVTGLAPQNDIASPFMLRNITFPSTAGGFTLGGGALSLYGNVANNAAATQTFSNNITLAANSTWAAAAGDIVIAGILGGGQPFTKGGTHVLRITGQVSIPGQNNPLCNSSGGGIEVSGASATFTIGNWFNCFPWWDTGERILRMTNGGQLIAFGDMGGNYGIDFEVVGAGSQIYFPNRNNFTTGDNFILNIADSAAVTNVNTLSLGSNNSTNGVLRVTGGSVLAVNTFGTGGGPFDGYVGGTNSAGNPSRLICGSGWSMALGIYGNTASNTVLTIGQGGMLTVNGSVSIGNAGNNNALALRHGGSAETAPGQSCTLTIGGSHVANSGLIVSGVDAASGIPSSWNVKGWLFAYGNSGTTDSHDTNNFIEISNGAMVTNTTVYIGTIYNDPPTDPWDRAYLIVTNGGKLFRGDYGYDVALVVGEKRSGCSALFAGTGTLFDAASKSVSVGTDPASCGNCMTISSGAVVTNVNNFHVARLQGANGYVCNSNRLEILAGGQLYTTGDNSIGDNTWYSGGSIQRAERNTVLVTGAGSLWNVNTPSYNPVYIGFGVYTNNACSENALIVADGGLVQIPSSITIGYNVSSAFNNRLVLGSGGVVQTPAVTVGVGSAISNTIDFAGGAIAAASLTVNGTNGFRVLVSDAPFVASTFTNVNLGPNVCMTPVMEGRVSQTVFPLLTSVNAISGLANLALDPAVDSGTWKLVTTATSITLIRRETGTLMLVR